MPPPGRRRVQLIDRRKHLGFTQESLANALEVSTSSIAQWERGAGTPTPRHRRKLADLLEIGLHGLDQLLDPDADPVRIEPHIVLPKVDHALSLEQGAAEIRAFEIALIPGIFQIRGYAEALMGAYHKGFTQDELLARLETRLFRHQALVRADDPLRFRAVIDESALQRPLVVPSAMVEQLEHLAAVSTLPNVEVRILPFDSLAISSAVGSFWLTVKPGAKAPFIACIDNSLSVSYHEFPAEVEQYDQLFSFLEREALDREQSRERIHRARKAYL